MLNRIHIQNFAISSEAEVEINDGMTVLTGETGAGKSILIDALDLVLGDRADAGVVRHGAERATISASFSLDENSPALAWLIEQELDDNDECHLRRVVSKEGRSRAFINNTPVNLSSLKSLGGLLIEIHGQHEHQTLLKTSAQRQQLDSAGDYADLLQSVESLSDTIRQHQQTLDDLQQRSEDNDAQAELLRYQIQELEALDITSLDVAKLIIEHEQLANVDSLRQLAFDVLQRLSDNEEDNIHRHINQIIQQLEPWLETSEELRSAHAVLVDISALTEDVSSSIHHVQNGLESDPQRLAQVDSLLAQLHELARKHHTRVEALAELYNDKQSVLAALEQDEQDLTALQEELQQLKNNYREAASRLHQHRQGNASKLSAAVTDNMQGLGMTGGQFEINVNAINEDDRYPRYGLDEVSYMVSANPGQPLQPLNKVASGGELSRISLAISVICASANNAPTMIFDEVDSGIGGGVAEIVGRQLLSLAGSRQVLCVTHLPQVAAQAHHHYRVVKTSSDAHTESRVIELEGESRIQEIARMLGGVEITEQSLAHARELLDTNHTARAG